MDLTLKPGQKIILMGTPDEAIEEAQRQSEAAPEIKDDFDIEEGDAKTLELKDTEEVKEKLERRIRSVRGRGAQRPEAREEVPRPRHRLHALRPRLVCGAPRGARAALPARVPRGHLRPLRHNHLVRDLHEVGCRSR